MIGFTKCYCVLTMCCMCRPLQVADHILSDPSDKTKVSLIFANVSESDILLKDKIDALAAKHPDQFKVYYVVDKAK